jgi:ABC-type branched-subunit amino acid transport system permease subunit
MKNSDTPGIVLPSPPPLLSRSGWAAFLLALVAVCILAPVMNLLFPPDSPFHMSDYAVALVGKIMCYAICALAMDLVWGIAGVLSLGHGLFFALGGYVMGMYLMRQIGRDGNYHATCQILWFFSIGKHCHGIGLCRTALLRPSSLLSQYPEYWHSYSGFLHFDQGSRVCIFQSSRKR